MRKIHRKEFKEHLEFLQAMLPTEIHGLSATVSVNGLTFEASYRPEGWQLLDDNDQDIAAAEMIWAFEANGHTKDGNRIRFGGLGPDPVQAYQRCIDTATRHKYGDELDNDQYFQVGRDDD